MQVEVHFLGRPEILVDKRRVQISQKKIEALVLYILFNQNCTRDELAGMFWCDCGEEAAKRNLRNSLYKIRVELGEDFILTKGNSYVYVNPEIEVKRDTDIFIMEDNEKKILDLKNFIFMDKVYLKNCVEFEKWVLSVQNVYERMITQKLLSVMNYNWENSRYSLAESYAKKILILDPHQEDACYILMKIYEKEQDYNRAIQIYRKFQENLKESLDLEPEEKTRSVYESILKKKQKAEDTLESQRVYFHEQNSILEEYYKFQNQEKYRICFLYGEAGMGKEKLWKTVQEDITKIESYTLEFVHAGKEIMHSGSYRIAEKLKEIYSFELREEIINTVNRDEEDAFLNWFHIAAKRIEKSRKKVCLFLKNVEWMDKRSFEMFLAHGISELQNSVFIILSYNSNYIYEHRFVKQIQGNPIIHMIYLKPLSEKESWDYLQSCLEKQNLHLDERELFCYTAGNLQMLEEIAGNIRRRKEEIYGLSQGYLERLDRILSGYSEEKYECLEALAVLERGAEIGCLAAIRKVEKRAVLKQMSELLACGILKEAGTKLHPCVVIKSKFVRDYIYNNMPKFKKWELHLAAMEYYRKMSKEKISDFFYLLELEYHSAYIESQNEHLYYEIYCTHCILDYSDEFFPIVGYDTELLQAYSYSRDEVYAKLYKLKEKLEKLENDMCKEQFCQLQMEIYYLLGRALNRGGMRDQGLVYTKKLIEMARTYQATELLIKGYIEAICYGVKAEDATMMKRYLEEVKTIRNLSDFQREYGTLLRLEAYCYILEEKYEAAEKLLKQSLGIFESPRYKETDYYKAAGAYDYLALTYRNQGKYEMALCAIEKAVKLCEGKNMQKGMDLFYEDYAYILFLQEKYKEAEHYFKISIQIYDTYGTYWMRSVAESCMAVIEMLRGNEKESLEYFRRAEIFSKKEMTNEETIVLEAAREALKKAKVL